MGLEGWSDFFAAQVGASAALVGLLIVAMSINIQRILAVPQLPSRAGQSLVMIGGSLVLASLALIPAHTLTMFGIESLIVCACLVLSTSNWLRKRLHQRENRGLTPILVPMALAAAFMVPLIAGSLLLVAGNEHGLYWIAIGIVLSYVSTLMNSWVLLIEILR